MGNHVGEVRAFYWEDDSLFILNQLLLPFEEHYRRVNRVEEVADSIVRMEVRGAPAIGIVAAYGMAFAASALGGCGEDEFLEGMERAHVLLGSTRPTAVNLFWALDRMLLVSRQICGERDRVRLLFEESKRIWDEDVAMNRKIGENGAKLFDDGARILTHCNTGALATGGIGTALGVIRAVHERSLRSGKSIHVWVDETRPYLQGSRLTAWELMRLGIDSTLISDNMAAYFMQQGEVDGVIVGADRIAQNGDTANKIGSYGLAVLCAYHGIKFYVAAPSSTMDSKARSIEDIVIEERDAEEVCEIQGKRIAPIGMKARHPAFDVIPSKLINGIISENGVWVPN